MVIDNSPHLNILMSLASAIYYVVSVPILFLLSSFLLPYTPFQTQGDLYSLLPPVLPSVCLHVRPYVRPPVKAVNSLSAYRSSVHLFASYLYVCRPPPGLQVSDFGGCQVVIQFPEFIVPFSLKSAAASAILLLFLLTVEETDTMPLYTKQYMYVYESTLLPLKQSEVRVAFKYYVWAWTDLGLVRLGHIYGQTDISCAKISQRS